MIWGAEFPQENTYAIKSHRIGIPQKTKITQLIDFEKDTLRGI